jgi:hypothetical protein
MVYFQTKNPTLGKFWRVLQSKMLVCMFIYYILYGHGLFMTISYTYFMPIGYIFGNLVYFSRFGVFWHVWYVENLATLV